MCFWNRKKEKPQEKYKEIPFQHLAPIDTVDDKTTFDALDYALSQNNIHNVALTGNYGAGKSSILESYIKQKNKSLFLKGLFERITKKKKSFLKISLATFAIENDIENSDNQKETIPQTTAQEIEKSILQQIFYRKSGKKFPYSHFSRIKKISFFRKLLTEVVILIVILIPLYLKKGNLYCFVKDQCFVTPDTFDFVLICLCIVAFLVVLYKAISLAYKLRLAKFSFQDAEIEFDENKKEESLLNKYLDELLYFFEVTNFNVVIFEDLDRFRNTEIFIKLRELNTLLNNYEKIHRRIVFIYALRDEVFKDSSRTKFFDFIIPVIPVINNQNSSDMLLNQWKENKDSPLGKIDESFLQDIGLYIDDMRLLKNSINEFKIYDKKVNEKDYKSNSNEKKCRDRNKIFALILYKNLYPNDFALLAQNKGELYSIFQKKKIVAEKETPALYQEIKQLEENLENLKRQIFLDINELRVVYVAKIFSKKPENSYVDKSIYDCISNEEFEKIQQGAAILCTNRYGYSYGNRDYISYSFSDIEKEVCTQYSYNQREKMLMDINSGKIENLKKQLAEKKALLSGIQQMSIAEMIDEFTPDQFVTDVKNIKKDFIIYLLRNGFIDENYFDYISYFYANSLSEDETQYLLLIKNQQNPNFALLVKNSNFSNVIARIKYNEWKLPAVLNYSVLYCILLFDDSHIDVFLSALWNYKRFNRNSLFLSKFRAEPYIQSKLYCRLYSLFSTEKDWFITLFDDEESIVVYKFFVAVDFKKTENDIITFLTNDISFLHRTDVDCSTIASKIDNYRLKFNLLEDSIKYPIYNIILDHNAYVMSKHNFDIIIKNAFADAVEMPIKDYYTCVSKLQKPNIKACVDQNIEIFVKNVVLSTGEPIAESEEAFVELLNNKTLLMETKIELIEKSDCVISDITKVKSAEMKLADGDEKSVDIRNLLYKHKKVYPAWSNVFEIFKIDEKKTDDSLIDYLNDEKIVAKLVKEKPLTNEEIKSENGNYDIASKFYRTVLNLKILTLDSFSELMDVCPWIYKKINYGIDQEKLNVLIEQEKLVLTQENYTGIKQNHVNILPKFIATYFDDFAEKWSELKIEITFDDMKMFLDSKELSKEQKNKLLSSDFDIWYAVSQQDDALTWLGRKIIELNLEGKVQVPIASVVANMDDADNVLKLLCLQGRNLKENEIIDVINSKMDESYRLCIKLEGKREKLPNTGLNKELCAILSEKGIISSYQEDGKKIKVIQKRM
jgi:hypothetical protein